MSDKTITVRPGDPDGVWRSAIDGALKMRLSWDYGEARMFIEWQMNPPHDEYKLRGFRSEEGFGDGDPTEDKSGFGSEFLIETRRKGTDFDYLQVEPGRSYFYTFFIERKNKLYDPNASSLTRLVDGAVADLRKRDDWIPVHKPFRRLGLVRVTKVAEKSEIEKEREVIRQATDRYEDASDFLEAKMRYEQLMAKANPSAKQDSGPSRPRLTPFERLELAMDEKEEALARLRKRGLTEADPEYIRVKRALEVKVSALTDKLGE